MNERTLWDYAEEECSVNADEEKDRAEHADRQRSRRKTIKKLRAGGHWLTLLRVARSIPQPFTLNDISVAVWKVCPEFFGMRGYPYPDNHKVHYILYGTRGLIAKGIIQRVRQGLFRIPDDVDIEEAASSGEQPESTGWSDPSPTG